MSSISNSVSDSDNREVLSDRRVMMFDLSVQGHHPAYIRYLLTYAYQTHIPYYIDIVVSPQFMQEHADVVQLCDELALDRVKFIAIKTREAEQLAPYTSAQSRARRAYQEWALVRTYAQALQADHCLILYLDTLEFPLWFGTPAPCPFSGIYFRPTFHYFDLERRRPTRSEWIQQWRERLWLQNILNGSQLHALFSLDPFAVPYINQLSGQTKAIALADPVDIAAVDLERAALLRSQLHIESERTVFLLFGALTGRKGVFKLLEALAQLSDEHCKQICLLVVGSTDPETLARIRAQIAAVRQIKPIQIIERYEYIPEAEITDYFQLADIALAPYQQHVGMSGILMLAAATRKPVLSSNYGLMGQVVKQNKLGIALDSTRVDELMRGLKICLHTPLEELGDTVQMQKFAARNSTSHFAETIFQCLEQSLQSRA